MSAASSADWAAAGCAGLSAISLIGLALAFADADLAYFDPRPLARRAADRLLVEVCRARHTPRELAVAAAALYALLTITPGATR